MTVDLLENGIFFLHMHIFADSVAKSVNFYF